MIAARVSTRVIAVLLTLAASSWAAAIFFAPLVHDHMPVASRLVDLTGSRVCHQRDARSFHLAGRRLPVCGRCTGLYVAGALGALIAWAGLPRIPSRTRALLIAAAVPTVASLAIEWAGIVNPGNVVRAGAALPLGATAGWLFVRLLRAEGQPKTCAIIT